MRGRRTRVPVEARISNSNLQSDIMQMENRCLCDFGEWLLLLLLLGQRWGLVFLLLNRVMYFKFLRQRGKLCIVTSVMEAAGEIDSVIYISYILCCDLSACATVRTLWPQQTWRPLWTPPPSPYLFPSSHPHLDIPPPLGGHLVPNQACPLQHSSPSSPLSTLLSTSGDPLRHAAKDSSDPPLASCLSSLETNDARCVIPSSTRITIWRV